MVNIGLFGGTFNPIHHGHLKMAEAAKKEYNLDVVYFIPCGVPPHKSKKDLLPIKLRMKLLKKAIKGKKYFKVLDIEIKKKKPCYTIDTILSLRGALATKQSRLNSRKTIGIASPLARNDNHFYFLIGQDELEELHTWKKSKELGRLVVFLVLPRLKRKIKPPIIKDLQWKSVHAGLINTSSTEIRKQLQKPH